MVGITHLAAFCIALTHTTNAAVTFAIPSKSGVGDLSFAPLDPALIGISFEFFAFPAYFTSVTATKQCLANWKDLTGVWPPIRIGGTTQDRASFDAASSDCVAYSVSSPADAPMALTFGPRFMTLAGEGKNDIENTIAAANVAVEEVSNLLAIELGNEPEYYPKDGQPIAQGTWNPSTDAASQIDWSTRISSVIGRENIIQAGNWNQAPPEWGAAQLIAKETLESKQAIRHYAHHNYPGGDVQKLQTHSQTASNIRSVFANDVAAVKQQTSKEYVLGETNSVSGGGAANVSPTFGAALWTLDYSLRAAASTNISRVYFHHGTVGNCQYCFWGRYSMGAPYYGATAAVAFTAGATTLAALDREGDSNYGGYVVFGTKEGEEEEGNRPVRVLLLNSDYYTGSGERRGTQEFVLTGLGGLVEGTGTVKAKRLTGASSLARVDRGDAISFGGQTYTDVTCVVSGEEVWEETEVVDRRATFEVKAAEALVVYL